MREIEAISQPLQRNSIYATTCRCNIQDTSSHSSSTNCKEESRHTVTMFAKTILLLIALIATAMVSEENSSCLSSLLFSSLLFSSLLFSFIVAPLLYLLTRMVDVLLLLISVSTLLFPCLFLFLFLLFPFPVSHALVFQILLYFVCEVAYSLPLPCSFTTFHFSLFTFHITHSLLIIHPSNMNNRIGKCSVGFCSYWQQSFTYSTSS